MEKLKELDKKILIGLGITIAFLFIWLITIPLGSFSKSPLDSYSGLNETQRHEQTTSDIKNFNAAVLMNDNTFCGNILNTTMKKECLDKAPAPSGTPPVQAPQEEKSVDDINNYNRAVLMNDKTYCENIVDTQMKAECSSRWTQ